MSAHPGLFLSLEGGEGAGKTTQRALLGQWLESLGHEVVLTREPGGTALGHTLRQALLHGEDIDARTEALLYAADRAHHVASLVLPALRRGAVVITDRYLDSSVAYQGAARSLGPQEIRDLSLWATDGLLPELTVLLDIDPAVGAARRSEDPDRLEREPDAFHLAVREQFLALARAEAGRFVVVDAAASPEAVHEQIRARVEPLLPERRRPRNPCAVPARRALQEPS
ncbi:dTMP kinase [Bogoriella caseilytica]|uniref:Thymidylate kinase n=1 Tax=Bogoriella caseilytica TaxID=56055 RepID=A0A3N2BD87_9MICO|nr:dTMP kinase [Bogoriella caseilytica]ROR73220.1 dTMP kinase [Bogoriella caseilytica]